VRTVSDQWQGGLCHGTLGSPAKIHDELRGLKVTHAIWRTGVALDHLSVASDRGADLRQPGERHQPPRPFLIDCVASAGAQVL